MGKKDRITSSSNTSTTTTTRNRRPSHEGHKTTAATLAKVAAAQEEIKKLSLEKDKRHHHHHHPNHNPLPPPPPPPPPAPPKDQQDQHHQKKLIRKPIIMGPSAMATATAIQRIAECGAPPLKLTTTSPSPTSKVIRKVTPSSVKHSFKSPGSSSSASSSGKNRSFRSSPTSPSSECPPPLPPRPDAPHRSSSAEGGLFNRVKKGREQIQSDGLKAAKFIGKKLHEASDKIKKRDKGSGSTSTSPQLGGPSPPPMSRDTSNDVEVFGMELKEAVMKTRIVKERKAEGDAAYWMPALAYRCLQYLNVHGPQELGIYRISGSTSVVDELRTEYKIRHDVDLFDEPPDDLHTVSSLFKGWFRSLPEAILPPDVQKRIYDRCKDEIDAPKPPQAFIDELSGLPPYNYYLLHHLFSHLSAICASSDINKMNLANLGMIFCSTLRIDRFCFNWLVNNWSECWAGCWTEEEEYARIQPKRRISNASSMAPSSCHPRSSPAPDSRSTSRTGRPEGSIDCWQSISSDHRLNLSPEPRSSSRGGRDRLGDGEGAGGRTWSEKDLERLRSRSPACKNSVYSNEDQKSINTVGTPRPSVERLEAPLPPIKPVSPMSVSPILDDGGKF